MSVDDAGVGVHRVLAQLQDVLEHARSMPMSASCVVNRGEVLALVDDLRARLPEDLLTAQEVLEDRDGVVADGHREAERLLGRAEQERRRMLAETGQARQARAEAERILAEARRDADAMRAEVEDYVDTKLATFEVVLGKTLEAVERGREELAGRHEVDSLRDDGPPAR